MTMSPRPYHSEQRRQAAEATRERIVAAAHSLLADPAGVSAFTVEAVAGRAGVARMTVYNQFGSKAAVLEALFDWLAVRGGIHGPAGLETALREPDPLEGVRTMFRAMARYYSVDRVVKRRVHALAALQPDVAQALVLREERRRRFIRTLLERIAATRTPWTPDRFAELEQLLFALTSFESFEVLAGPHRSFTEVAPLLGRSACAILLAE
jgi:AcrR family transcriptional regulator